MSTVVALPALTTLAGAGCGASIDDQPDAVVADAVAAYIYLDEDPFAADDFVDPITMCRGYDHCDASGFIHGLMRASVSPVLSGGWALELEFDRSISDNETATLQRELERRAAELGVGPIVLLEGDDEWPSCRHPPDCLTVDESVLP